jgi:hypothetical protein
VGEGEDWGVEQGVWDGDYGGIGEGGPDCCGFERLRLILCKKSLKLYDGIMGCICMYVVVQIVSHYGIVEATDVQPKPPMEQSYAKRKTESP